jgi:hypothetical protein
MDYAVYKIYMNKKNKQHLTELESNIYAQEKPYIFPGVFKLHLKICFGILNRFDENYKIPFEIIFK